ncbi:MAG: SPFH domain-containing protein [Epsilonproteobacteria bacterium]|nr:SPFH domain-containing protein [Campylobacterota bacterium]
MGFFDWIGGQFIDVIEWVDNSNTTMVYRFPRAGNEIKYGAKLTVRESQVAIFVNEGVIADVLTPGIYELETKNLPIITTLQHWNHGFNSPFKAEVYFLNTKRFTNLKWGTKNPIMMRDPEFKMVRVRAFGTYEIRITEPKKFMTEIVGTDGHFGVDEIETQITNLILSKFASALSQNTLPILDLVANYESFGDYMREKIASYMDEYGLMLTKVFVENISLPSEVEEALDKRTSREISGDLNQHMKYQASEGMANGNSGTMGDFVGMGMAMSMGNEMVNQMNQPPKVDKKTPPPLPSVNLTQYHVAIGDEVKGPYDIRTIQLMIKQGTIKKETLLWTESLQDWEVAEKLIGKYFTPSVI